MSRRKARLAAIEILYAADVRGEDPEAVLAERAGEQDGLPSYTTHLVTAVRARREEIDAILDRTAAGWPVGRMSAVDRNILRVGVLELLEEDTPFAVVLDEAVVNAKRLSGEDAGRFVNGVLAAVHRGVAS